MENDFLLLDQINAAINNEDPNPKTEQKVEYPNVLKTILNNVSNIDYQISKSDYLNNNNVEYIGYTALNFAYQANNLQAFKILLDRGVDFTLRDHNNRTVIHKVIEENFASREKQKLVNVFQRYDACFAIDDGDEFFSFIERNFDQECFKDYSHWRLRRKLNNTYVDAVLSAHIKYDIPKNPCSVNGISHFHAACMANNVEAVEFFLNNGVHANQYVNLDSPIYPGFTPLHFAIWYTDVKIAMVLLKHGADIYMKNSSGQSPLQMLLDLNMKTLEWMQVKGKLPYDNAIVDFYNAQEILDAMMPKFDKGTDMLVFCAACTLKHTLWFENLLRNIKDVNESLNEDSWPGWTALHFATFYNNIEIVKLLLQAGGDLEAKNANGVTPFDMLLSIARKNDIIFILSTKPSWKNILLSDGKTLLLDVINAMNDKDVFVNFLKNIYIDTFIPTGSPLWSGCTILHLTVMFSEKLTLLDDLSNYTGDDYVEKYNRRRYDLLNNYLQNIKICLMRNANVNLQDINGRTPAHQAFRQRELYAINYLYRYDKRVLNIVDNDNLSTLHIACASKIRRLVNRLYVNRKLLDLTVMPSFKWQNKFYDNAIEENYAIADSTALHISLMNEDEIITSILMRRGPNVNLKDSQDLTPIHRAFCMRILWKLGNSLYEGGDDSEYCEVEESLTDTCKVLLSSPNLKESIVDCIGLSHLHVACYENNFNAVEKLLDQGSDPNVSLINIEKLDTKHPLSILQDNSGYTSLQMTLLQESPELEIQKILIEREADILWKADDGSCFFLENLMNVKIQDQIDVSFIRQNEIAEKRLLGEYGWTMLHVACQLQDFELAKESLKNGVNIDSQIHKDAKFYAGFTALHIAMSKGYNNMQKLSESEINRLIQLLLDNNANVSLTNIEQNSTALHLSNILLKLDSGYDLDVYYYEASERADLILRHVKNFTKNPVDDQGFSMFHIACIRHDLEAMENFLKSGVDVDQTTECFRLKLSGCSPLHLVVKHMPQTTWKFLNYDEYHQKIDIYEGYRTFQIVSEDQITRQLQAFNLLIKYGADVHARDSYNNTLFHAVIHCRVPNIHLLEKIFEAGVDITLKNIYGRNPFQELFYSSGPGLWDVSPKMMEFFFKHVPFAGAVNSVTHEIALYGMGPYLREIYANSEPTFLKIMGLSTFNGVDNLGRTAIHCVVSSSRSCRQIYEGIDYLLGKGIDIDQQDNFGRTALHIAAMFHNSASIECLLQNDADFNIINSYEKTAFSYAAGPIILPKIDFFGEPELPFIQCFHEMELRGLHINEINKKILNECKDNFLKDFDGPMTLKVVKNKNIGSTLLTFDDFWLEIGAIVDYPKMPKKQRKKIDKFFKKLNLHSACEWLFPFKLQYKKAVARSQLVECARDSMSKILKFSLPSLCFDVVQQFLSNQDLKSLVRAVNYCNEVTFVSMNLNGNRYGRNNCNGQCSYEKE